MCPKCEEQRAKKFQFCGYCGADLSNNLQANEAQSPIKSPTKKHQSPKAGKRVLLAFLCFLIAGIVISAMFDEEKTPGDVSSKSPTTQTPKDLTSEEIAALGRSSTVEVDVHYIEKNLIFKDSNSAWMGSGVIIDKIDNQYWILTNQHVTGIREMYNSDSKPEISEYEVTVIMPDGKKCPAEKIYINEDLKDYAILIVEVPGSAYPVLQLSDTLPPQGAKVYAMGHPKGLLYTFTSGVLSAIRDDPSNGEMIQIDAPINHGNSGGPLMDGKGRLIGVNTSIRIDSEGLNFAISSREILQGINSKKMLEIPTQPNELTALFKQIKSRK